MGIRATENRTQIQYTPISLPEQSLTPIYFSLLTLQGNPDGAKQRTCLSVAIRGIDLLGSVSESRLQNFQDITFGHIVIKLAMAHSCGQNKPQRSRQYFLVELHSFQNIVGSNIDPFR